MSKLMSFYSDKQRRWFFANYPEFGHHKSNFAYDSLRQRAQRRELGESLDSLNKLLGTSITIPGFSLPRPPSRDMLHAAQSTNILTGYGEPTDFGGAFMPRLPTMEELSRLPREMAMRFFRLIDTLLQNNPLIIDPNALERHHGLPKEFVKYFLDCGLTIEDFLIIMRRADHRLKPKGVHTGKGRGGDWNSEWNKFMKEYPPENSDEHRDRIGKKLGEMKRKYGIK